MNARDENDPITETYGHGSIKLTAYPSSRRVRVEASADNSVMDWSDLFQFVDQIRRPRTITTAEELDALPEDTVIRTAGHEEFAPRVAVKTLRFDSGVSYWHVADADDFESTSDELDDLPAIVLYEPEPQP